MQLIQKNKLKCQKYRKCQTYSWLMMHSFIHTGNVTEMWSTLVQIACAELRNENHSFETVITHTNNVKYQYMTKKHWGLGEVMGSSTWGCVAAHSRCKLHNSRAKCVAPLCWSLSVWTLHVLPVLTRVLSGYSGFPPPSFFYSVNGDLWIC